MRAFAFIYGIIFLVIGIGGFLPAFVVDNQLFQVFRVNLWLNSLHVLSGIFALIIGFWNRLKARTYFKIIGILYAIMALFGFIYEDHKIFGLFANNRADTWFHVIIAVAALILGFGRRD